MMRPLRLVLTLIAIMGAAATVWAQPPRVAYILPDIGTTRFGTYVEIIAPHTAVGTFGADGVSLNGPSDNVRVECERAADNATITIGPVVVSWDGRLVSTIIYVNPLVTPNSEDWQQLLPAYRIPIRVVVNGNASNTDTFYVVRPWPLGNVSASSERVLGEGALGKRSRRGAMLVDSLLLAGGATPYTFSLRDPDAQAPGNQAFLPVVLLSRGAIRGVGGTADISVSASGMNAGPGGGGGAGEYHNLSVPTSPGTGGGNGYTGGGPGGFNNAGVGFPANTKEKPGIGSGEELPKATANTRGSAALNGVPGGESTVSFENAGGGTGHPFGESGVGCDNRVSCVATGRSGGGSGGRDGVRGGAAGYGEVGQSETGVDLGGRVHGNAVIVPLAGGSGGAGGNPELAGDFASGGGGGGGAIAIHANFLSALNVSARGSVGSRQKVRGGGGSGGGVIVGGRLDNPVPADAITVQVSGGSDPDPNPNVRHLAGGRGRARYDGGIPLNLPVSIGVVTDTITNSLRTDYLQGHGNGSDLRVYIKPENGPWQLGPLITNYRVGNSGFWRIQITWPGQDTLYYVAVGQVIANPTTGSYTDEPDVLLSQSAWNIVRIYGPAIIDADRTLDMGSYRCPGSTQRDTVWVRNIGESPLEVSAAAFTGDPGFRLAAPVTFPDTILPFDSSAYIVEFTPAAGQTGVANGTLRLDNSDTAAGKNPFNIAVRSNVQPYDFTYSWRGIGRDTIDIGRLCVGKALSDPITIRNVGTSAVTIIEYASADPANLEAVGNVPFLISGPLGFSSTTITFRARNTGVHVTPVLVRLAECERPDTLWVRYEGVEPIVRVIGTTQFGTVRVGDTPQLVVALRNDGTSDLAIGALPPIPGGQPFRLVTAVPPPPAVLAPGASMLLTYAYEPVAAGDHATVLRINVDSTATSCATSVDITLAGGAITTPYKLSAASLTFGTVTACDSLVDSVTVTNEGGAPVTLRYPVFISGTDAAVFRVLRQPLSDTELGQGESVTYVLGFYGDQGPQGVRSAQILVRTNDPNVPQITVPLTGVRASAGLQGPTVIDLGVAQLGSTVNAQRTYTNTSAGILTVASILSSQPSRTSTNPTTISMNTGVSTNVTFSHTASSLGPVEDTLRFIVTEPCADTVIVVVRVLGVSSSISAQTTLDMGVVSECTDRRDSIVYVNSSATTLDLIDVAILGRDAPAFRLENPGVVSNQTLQPGERRVLYVLFDPRLMTDGRKSAVVTTRARVNGVVIGVSTSVTGERRTVVASAPDVVGFGTVNLGTTSTQRIAIVNRGTQPLSVTSVSMAGSAGAVYTVRSTPPAPFTLAPGERAEVLVEFAPVAQQLYRDSVIITYNQPCVDQRVIPVSGTGRLSVEVEISLPEVTLDPALEDYRLPISAAVVSGGTDISDGRLELTIRFVSSVFAPRSLSTGTITRSVVTGGMTELDLVIPQLAASGSASVIGEIIGDMTLGDTVFTDLEIVRAVLTSNTVTPTVRTNNGSMTLDICEEGGPRLITRSGSLSVVARPNPAQDHVEIVATVFERGLHRIDVVTITGDVVASTTFNAGRDDRRYVLPVDARSLASGTYQIILQTPTRRRVLPLSIFH